MRKILMLLLTAAMCLTACGKDAPLPEVPVEPEAPPAAAGPDAPSISLPAAVEDPGGRQVAPPIWCPWEW